MKSFSTLYQELYQECHDSLESLRKEALKKRITLFIILFLICILIFFVSTTAFTFALFISILISALVPFSNKYKKQYKDTVIKKLVSFYDPNLSFSQNGRISRSTYNEAEFERYDYFYSNDLISGKIDNEILFEASDVRTEDESTDSDGNTSRTIVFSGLFSSAKFNTDIKNTIKIRSDKGFLGKLLPANKQLIQLDSQEFEKLFDVYSTDKILALRILTSDILDYMINFKKENKIKYELTLKNSSLYIRIHCKDMFEAPFSKDSLDFDTLHMYYKIIHFVCELNRKFYHTVEGKDI